MLFLLSQIVFNVFARPIEMLFPLFVLFFSFGNMLCLQSEGGRSYNNKNKLNKKENLKSFFGHCANTFEKFQKLYSSAAVPNSNIKSQK